MQHALRGLIASGDVTRALALARTASSAGGGDSSSDHEQSTRNRPRAKSSFVETSMGRRSEVVASVAADAAKAAQIRLKRLEIRPTGAAQDSKTSGEGGGLAKTPRLESRSMYEMDSTASRNSLDLHDGALMDVHGDPKRNASFKNPDAGANDPFVTPRKFDYSELGNDAAMDSRESHVPYGRRKTVAGTGAETSDDMPRLGTTDSSVLAASKEQSSHLKTPRSQIVRRHSAGALLQPATVAMEIARTNLRSTINQVLIGNRRSLAAQKQLRGTASRG